MNSKKTDQNDVNLKNLEKFDKISFKKRFQFKANVEENKQRIILIIEEKTVTENF